MILTGVAVAHEITVKVSLNSVPSHRCSLRLYRVSSRSHGVGGEFVGGFRFAAQLLIFENTIGLTEQGR